MALSIARRANFLAFLESSELLRGRQLHIREAISTDSLNFNRHFTTHSEFAFTLTHLSWRLSGGRIMLLGSTELYEIGADQLVEFSMTGNGQYEFIEKYSDTVFRRTIVQVALPAT